MDGKNDVLGFDGLALEELTPVELETTNGGAACGRDADNIVWGT